jgi:hypothetical protein
MLCLRRLLKNKYGHVPPQVKPLFGADEQETKQKIITVTELGHPLVNVDDKNDPCET